MPYRAGSGERATAAAAVVPRGSQLIYSVDSENVPLVQARHTVHGGAREERRLHFSVGRRPYRLSIGHVQPEDEDVYFCLVSFPSGTSINASVSLVIVGEFFLSCIL
ncbi:hypothetical protein MRX96_029469 [Rhipicephalus microplus]